MNLNQTFATLLRHHRERIGMSQERLAELASLDRTYVSQLERGLKSPTLNSIERLANCLNVPPAHLIEELVVRKELDLRVDQDYILRDCTSIHVRRGNKLLKVSANYLVEAIDFAHELIEKIYAIDLDIAAVLGLRNLSAFIGELFRAAVVKSTGSLFRANPHQDGYPDLLLMDDVGRRAWETLTERLNEKRPFSPFPGGGIEVKATCGSVPSPAKCREREIEKPGLGDERIDCMTGYDWKTHHRDTNNLVGLLWDFIERRPRIVALFYSCDLEMEDWGKIVQPRNGGGRTTSVSIMGRSGLKKMYTGWMCVINDERYARFLNRRNRDSLIPVA